MFFKIKKVFKVDFMAIFFYIQTIIWTILLETDQETSFKSD